MKYLSPQIEDDGTITVHDIDAPGYRRQATPDETIAALIYMVSELQAKLRRLSE